MNKEDKNGNHLGQWSQGVGGYIEFRVWTTPKEDTRRWHLPDPPDKVIPIIFLPGIMGSNLRLSKKRQEELKYPDNRAWRPDDLTPFQVISGAGYAGRLTDADARERQLNFDPDATEVETYHYTEDKSRFDSEGEETLASDARHQNVPDGFSEIPPMLTNVPPAPREANHLERNRKRESAAQRARWRGWSEIMFDGAYGKLLKTVEARMNNIHRISVGAASVLHPDWTKQEFGRHKNVSPSSLPRGLVDTPPADFGAASGDPITEAELDKIAHCWYPVHAMGYNWLKSNGDGARALAPKITALIDSYKEHGMNCEKVMLVTHSMGGLLARALIHPKYGNIEDKVLGIYHSAMPTHGAAVAYKRIRCGFGGGRFEGKILGDNGKDVTCVLANSPGGLELLPNVLYGNDWLKVVDENDKELASWPSARQSLSAPQQDLYQALKKHPPAPYSNREDALLALNVTISATKSIYTQPNQVWWRLFNPLWVNPAHPDVELGEVIKGTNYRIAQATKFQNDIALSFHPVTYASYCASPTQKSYEQVVWKVESYANNHHGQPAAMSAQDYGPPESWQLYMEDGKGRLVVQTRTGGKLSLKLQGPSAPGDGTVSAARSAEKTGGIKFMHGSGNNTATYNHQDSYADPQVLASTLYALVKIANKATWWEK